MNSSKSLIEIFVPAMPCEEKLRPYLKMIDEKRVYTNFGPLVHELESRISRYFGLSPGKVTLLSNATMALEGAIQVTGIKDWLSPSWSFTATGQALLRSNVRFKFTDVAEDWRISDSSLADFAKVHEGKYAVVDVLPFGDDLNLSRFRVLPQTLLIDGAASFDSLRNIGQDSYFQSAINRIGIVVSLHATKLFSSGEGGVFISNDDSWVEEVRNWSRFGFRQGARTSDQIGTNAKMHEYSAAVGLASFDDWQKLRERLLRQLLWSRELTNQYGFEVTRAMSRSYISPYWIIRGEKERIAKLTRLCLENNISTRKWWESGMHNMPAFSDIPRDNLTFTETLSEETIGLPFHIFLEEEDLQRIKYVFGLTT